MCGNVNKDSLSPKRKGFLMQAVTRRRALSCIVLLFPVLLSAACTKVPQVVLHTSGGSEVRVPVELALTDDERRRGLMYRRDLDTDAGMLFVFPKSTGKQV